MRECPDCDGPDAGASMALQSKGNGRCSSCHGEGRTVMDDITEDFGGEASGCSNCNSTGVCPTCDGEGLIDGDDD